MRTFIIIFLVLAIVGVIAYFLLRKPKTVSVPQIQPDGTVTTVQMPAPTKQQVEAVAKSVHGKG